MLPNSYVLLILHDFFTFYFGVECVNTQNIPLVMAMGVNRITY